MKIGRAATAFLLFCGYFGLVSCESGDWRTRSMADAEDKMRSYANDPSAQFSRVQVAGDSSTGQICGFIKAKAGPTAPPKSGRFIVYIDETAGPFVENGIGPHPMARDDFDFAWQNDCLNEGYKP